MTDLETGRPPARPARVARPVASEQARARRAAARQRRASQAPVAPELSQAPELSEAPVAPEALEAGGPIAPPEQTTGFDPTATIELDAYVEAAPGQPAGPEQPAASERAAGPERSADPNQPAASEQPPSRTRQLRSSLARLDAVAAARPFPDPAIGLDLVEPTVVTVKKPLLVRLLRLQHVRPTGWQRAAVGDLPILVAVLLVLADLATAWTLIVLPVVVLGLVKFHDVIESRLAPVPVQLPVARPFGEADPGS